MTPVEEIKQKIDLVEFVKGYVKLAKSGASWKGLCPFHQEKTPSFFVSPVRQVWYCFGCHKGGDLFKFVTEIEHLEFPEALKMLAEKAGIRLRREDPQLRSKKNRLAELLEVASDFYQKQLPKDSAPYRYLQERGLKHDTIKEFKVGFAPAGWRNLYDLLSQLGFTPEEMEQAGLLIRRGTSETDTQTDAENISVDPRSIQRGSAFESYYDRFRSRIMFPIFDTNNRVIGFSGRVFGPVSDESAKYINTPETLLFNKGQTLYGLEHAKQDIRQANSAVLVEGQMDFLMAWQDGIRNVIASSGTALTSNHLTVLKRLCQNLILAFDTDTAGQSATDRSIAMASRLGFEVKIASLPQGKDVADFVKMIPGKLKEILSSSGAIMDYYFAKTFGASGVASREEKKASLSYFLPRLKALSSPVDQAYWIEKLARKLQIQETVLAEELRRTPAIDEEITTETQEGISPDIMPEKTRLEILAERALSLVFQVPERAKILEAFVAYFPYRFSESARIIALLPEEKLKTHDLPPEFPGDLLSYLLLKAEYEKELLGDRDIGEELSKTLAELKQEKIRSSLREISLAIQEAEFAKNEERVRTLTEEFGRLSQELSRVAE